MGYLLKIGYMFLKRYLSPKCMLYVEQGTGSVVAVLEPPAYPGIKPEGLEGKTLGTIKSSLVCFVPMTRNFNAQSRLLD